LLANLYFSLTIAFTATVWLAITQTDRLVLSRTLTLSAYGVFSIAIVAAATVSALNGALGQAILPRLTKFVAEEDTVGMTRLYRDATQTACVIAAPVVAILTFFADPVLVAWTGRAYVAHEAAPILRLYAIGNGLAWLSSFPYYLQYAKGNLKLHLIGNMIELLLLVPLIIVTAQHYGPVGTGAVWALSNGLFFLVYVPVAHARFLPGNHWKWLGEDILSIGVPVMAVAWLLAGVLPQQSSRWWEFAEIATTGLSLILIASIGSTTIRDRALALVRSPRIRARVK
jgi:O-antigen/teichoic acid export membrane protein